jgi:hypothetical protein
MNKPCIEYQDKIAEMVIGNLPEHETNKINKHLKSCPACKQYADSLQKTSGILTDYTQKLNSQMPAQQNKTITALERIEQDASPKQPLRILFRTTGYAVAAAIILCFAFLLGRASNNQTINVDQLRADILSQVKTQLASALVENQQIISAKLTEQTREDMEALTAQIIAESEKMLDGCFTELIQIIEAGRLQDRQQIYRAFEQIELNRIRDKNQITKGLQTLVSQAADTQTLINN